MSSTTDALVGGIGVIAICGGGTMTVWGMVQGQDVNSVGLAGTFVVGLALMFAGFFHLMPSEIALGDKGTIKMKAAAEAAKTVKESANEAAEEATGSAELVKAVMEAQDEGAATQTLKDIAGRVVGNLPSSIEVMNRVDRAV